MIDGSYYLVKDLRLLRSYLFAFRASVVTCFVLMELMLLMRQCAGTQLDSSITLARYVKKSLSSLSTCPRRLSGSYSRRDGTKKPRGRPICKLLLAPILPVISSSRPVPSRPVPTNCHWVSEDACYPNVSMCAKAVLAFPFKMSAWHESLVDLLIRFNLLILLLLFSQTVIHALSILMVKRKFSSSQLEGILVYVVLTILYLCICNFS